MPFAIRRATFWIALSTCPHYTIAAEPESTARARQAAQAAFSSVLQGDAIAALRRLRAVPPGEFVGKSADFRHCMIERFDRATVPGHVGTLDDAFVRSVLLAYENYWWHALTLPAQREHFTAVLLRELRRLLGANGEPLREFDALEPVLTAALQQHGYHALQGITPPLHELMLWHRQDTREYDVVLPEQAQHVTVQLLDAFASKGWSDYGSCGLGGTGGWTDDHAIYALAPSYPDLQDESYRVSLLAHEGQHFADKHRGWELHPWELEYRAKLTELALAEHSSRSLLQAFAQNQGEDADNPHAYANRRVLQALRRKLRRDDAADLSTVVLPELQAAARAVLLEDSAARLARPA